MKTQKHSLQLLYDEEGYCYGNSEWFIILEVSTSVAITDCSWQLYSDDIIFVIICRKIKQSWSYKRTCLCQDDKKKPLQKIISFKNQDMKLKGILLSNSKTFEGGFRHAKREECVNSLVDRLRKRVAAMSCASQKTEGWRNSLQTDKKVFASNEMNQVGITQLTFDRYGGQRNHLLAAVQIFPKPAKIIRSQI